MIKVNFELDKWYEGTDELVEVVFTSEYGGEFTHEVKRGTYKNTIVVFFNGELVALVDVVRHSNDYCSGEWYEIKAIKNVLITRK